MENKAKQKAAELIERFYNYLQSTSFDTQTGKFYTDINIWKESAKQCALICCDEIIQSGILTPQLKRHYVNGYPPTIEELEFWQSVRTEIINHK